MNEIIPADGARLPADRLAAIINAFWANKTERTVKIYREDLHRLAAWRQLATIDDFARYFLALSPGDANLTVTDFMAWAQESPREWAPSYVNNHLAALRSLVKFARRAGAIVWALDVDDLRVEPPTDTAGPGLDGMVATLKAAANQPHPARAARDVAILAMFATMGLRRDEVVSLDLEHVDFKRSRALVKRKRKRVRVPVTMPEQTAQAVQAWLGYRRPGPGPLFTSWAVAKRREGSRLAESSVWAMVRKHAERAGIGAAWPHGFRHAAITAVLDLTNGNVREAQRFAGHSSPTTTMRYDDNRRDIAGEAAAKVADAIEKKLKESGQ